MRALLLCVSAVAIALIVADGSAVSRAGASDKTSVDLTSESDWVGAHSRMHLSFRVSSSLPTTDLGVKLTLYSRLTSRYAFDASETGKEPSSEIVLSATPIIPIPLLLRTTAPNAPASVSVRVVTAPTTRSTKLASPVLALDCQPGTCDGVYPLSVVVVDRSTDKPLASFTTDVIYLTGTAGTYPLNVAFVFSVGTGLGLSPGGRSMVSLRRIVALDDFVRAVAAQSATAMTVNAYSQIFLALQRSSETLAKTTLAGMRALVESGEASGTLEMLDAPFTEVERGPTRSRGAGPRPRTPDRNRARHRAPSRRGVRTRLPVPRCEQPRQVGAFDAPFSWSDAPRRPGGKRKPAAGDDADCPVHASVRVFSRPCARRVRG